MSNCLYCDQKMPTRTHDYSDGRGVLTIHENGDYMEDGYEQHICCAPQNNHWWVRHPVEAILSAVIALMVLTIVLS